MSLPNTIAVDGPASSGKSTVSFDVAQRISYLFVDTGAFYRAITLLALEHQLDLEHTSSLLTLCQHAQLDLTPDLANDGRQYTFLSQGRDITWEIHSPAVDANVSLVAANPEVRNAILETQRILAARGHVIMVGRDIGTVVLPHADLKIYIDASLEKRAERRYQQRICNDEPADLDVIRKNLQHRDQLDSNRDTAPLLRAPDAIYLDTDELSQAQTVETMYQLIKTWDTTTTR